MTTRPSQPSLYQLKVTLRDIRPPIWRRFLVPENISLRRLHDALQMVMGWGDSHLHEFDVDGVLYGPPDRELGEPRESETRTKLNQVLRSPGDRLNYEYDFGDGWSHVVLLEKIREGGAAKFYPMLVAGRRACPPEDVGGPPGYLNFLEALADPQHPEHAEMLQWAGGSFDPEAFDVDSADPGLHEK